MDTEPLTIETCEHRATVLAEHVELPGGETVTVWECSGCGARLVVQDAP